MAANGSRLLATICLAGSLVSCQLSRGQPGVLIASTPPGATISIDGQESGYVTPAAIFLPRTDWHRIDVGLAGYVPATRIVGPGTQTTVTPWTAGWIGVDTFWFPLFLNARGLLLPLQVDDDLQPSRIHIRLRLLED
ncbi:PEGA domain-containing protein [Engelhardtia mirabilis]|uniref:PEGA domain protein n=1 Tax=Engelhardtia mirabilis TaxID=2528011 RepID=A0A518BKD6_9BACT|nr:PEGA domain protein [Planctomycetes bacterium Pla133]QDV01765.1 PEGA domain protein [Planctomycetes bacterium Pla86]